MTLTDKIECLQAEIKQLKDRPILGKMEQAERCLDLAMIVIMDMAEILEQCQGDNLKVGGSV